MNKLGFFIAGAVGLITGAVGGYFVTRKKYENIIDEEIAEVKEEYKARKEEMAKDAEASKEETTTEEAKEAEKTVVEPKPDISKVAKKIIKKEAPATKAYIITPDSFGEEEDYSRICMTYYEGDDILANEEGEPIDDPEELFGFNPIPNLGEYEPDSIHLQDDTIKCYYEILRDVGYYTDDPRHKIYRKE